MNIINRFLKGDTVEQSTAGILEQLEGEERSRRQQQAEQIEREKRATAEYRARITAEANERLARAYSNLDELGDLIPRLWLALGDFNRNVAEINEKGLGYDHGGLIEDTLCLPVDFASKMLAAIADAAPNTVWDYGHTGPLAKGVKAERPKMRGPLQMRTPHFYEPPPFGWNGRWPPEREPLLEGAGSGTFLP